MAKPCSKRIILLLAVLVLPASLFPQNTQAETYDAPVYSGTIPEALLLPLRGEAPRYPRDMVIGNLGQGSAPDEAWKFAVDYISALMAGQLNAPVLAGEDMNFLANCFAALDAINPFRYHLGGGRIEPDGTASYLVRFLGREQWIAGELYLRQEENGWRSDDFILEESRSVEDGINTYTYDFTPYERFF